MKILVTGGAGFIGSHVVDALLARGHEVHVLDDFSSGRSENVPSGVPVHAFDVRSQEAARLLQEQRYEVMVHHAAQMDVRRSVADPRFDADVNVSGFLNLMQAGVKSGLRRVVFASTGGAIYGEPDYVPQDEHHEARPLSPYGITKLTTEKYLFYYKIQYGISYVALRYANIYGPRQNPHGEAGVVAIFSQRMLSGENPVINGDGGQTRDYTFVGDVVRANVAALTYDGSGTFNIGTGVETSVVELFRRIRELSGSDAPETHVEAKPGEQRRSVLSSELARKELGWAPEVDLQEGLRQTVAWFRERTLRATAKS
ncbi:MAG TPA: SDR family oxidoreductase [Rhodothermales bacterium]